MRAELGELRSELRAVREENARIEKRLERVELLAPTAARARPPAPKSQEAAEVPSLTVVRLKPKADPAPKLQTATPVVEPSVETLDALSAAAAAPEEDPVDPLEVETEFEKGVSALKTGNLEGGVDLLLRFVERFPKHSKADNALYFSGVGLMGLSAIEDAAHTFERVLAAYPAGDAASESMLKLAECEVKLNKPAEAKAVYEKLVSTFPGTAAAQQASARLSR